MLSAYSIGCPRIGDYFGEKALVEKTPRTATVKAHGPLKCAALSIAGFERLMVREKEKGGAREPSKGIEEERKAKTSELDRLGNKTRRGCADAKSRSLCDAYTLRAVGKINAKSKDPWKISNTERISPRVHPQCCLGLCSSGYRCDANLAPLSETPRASQGPCEDMLTTAYNNPADVKTGRMSPRGGA